MRKRYKTAGVGTGQGDEHIHVAITSRSLALFHECRYHFGAFSKICRLEAATSMALKDT